MKHEAIYALYPQVVTIDDGTGAFDKDGNNVEIDISAVNAKAIELKNIQIAKEEEKANAKKLALSKLTALGLTDDEVKALLGTA